MMKNTKHEEKISEIKTELFVIETKFTQIENQFAQKLKNQQQQIERLSMDLDFGANRNSTTSQKIKASPFKSSMPAILLDYKESLKLKLAEGPRQFLINNTTYFIDKHGYLMDDENYYLIDSNGMRIQL